jgi:hypothetical protein
MSAKIRMAVRQEATSMRHRLTRNGLKPRRTRAALSIALALPFLVSQALPVGAHDAMRSLTRATLAAWPAPVGHRQPGAVDIPAGSPAANAESDMLDRSINQKLQICRGC